MSSKDTEKNVKEMKKECPKCEMVDAKDYKLGLWGARHTLSLMLFLAFSCDYALRVNLSVAIVAMVNDTSSPTDNTSTSDQCPYPDDQNNDDHYGGSRNGEFYWNEATQGLILGSFFWGYLLTNIPGGVMSEYFGGKIVGGIGITLTGVLTLISPWAAGVSSKFFIVIRFLEGMAEGVFYPAINNIIPKWYPKKERSKFSAFFFSGMQFGTVVSMMLSGYLCSTDFLGGWPSAFYVIGFLTVIWGVLWFILIKDNPQDHPRISKEELRYITDGCPILKKETVPLPIKEILKSKVFWAIAFAHFGQNWGLYTLLTEIPTYFDSILHIKMQNNGLYTALPYIGGWIFSNVFGYFSDILLKKNILTLVQVRRWAMVAALYGPMVCLIGMCFVDCNSTAAVAILFLGGTLNGAMFCGYMCSHADISPRFSASLMGITNTIATIPGFVSPAITGAITNANNTIETWRIVFIIAIVVYFFSNLVFLIFVTTDVQPWNEPVVKDSKIDSEGDSKIVIENGPKSNSNNYSKTDSKEDLNNHSKNNSKIDSNVDFASDSKGDSKIDSKTDSKNDPKVDYVSDTKDDSKIDSKIDSKNDSEVDYVSDTKDNSKNDSKNNSKRNSEDDSRTESKTDDEAKSKEETN
ncbi:UNVERIFIED_CONTAM: hypothetical protein RMT77_006202 [Armadillidium vulgare]